MWAGEATKPCERGRGIGVEHADAAADNLGGVEAGDLLAEARFVFPQHLLQRVVDVEDLALVVGDADWNADMVERHFHARIELGGLGAASSPAQTFSAASEIALRSPGSGGMRLSNLPPAYSPISSVKRV